METIYIVGGSIPEQIAGISKERVVMLTDSNNGTIISKLSNLYKEASVYGSEYLVDSGGLVVASAADVLDSIETLSDLVSEVSGIQGNISTLQQVDIGMDGRLSAVESEAVLSETHRDSTAVHVSITSAWTTISPLNGWTQMTGGYRTIAYMRILIGGYTLVRFKGRLNASGANSDTFFQLPSNGRPGATCLNVAWGDGSPCCIQIDNTGDCKCFPRQNVSLEGISFII